MQSIISSLKDPAWWFTAFVVGIIVSVVAGFLKDWVSGVFSKYSERFRESRKVKAAHREELFEALATNDVYLILSMIRLMGLVIFSFVIMLFYFSLPAITELREILCAAVPAVDKCVRVSYSLIEKSIIMFTGAFAMIASYKASSRFGLVMEGVKRYRKRHGLPRVV